MKRLLISVAALLVATLMFSLDQEKDVKDNVTSKNKPSVEQRVELNS